MGIGGQCRLRPSAGLDKEVLSFQKEVLRVSLFSNYSKKLLKTGPPVLIICTFSMEPGARCTVDTEAFHLYNTLIQTQIIMLMMMTMMLLVVVFLMMMIPECQCA